MIPESVSLKVLAATGGILAGLTVLVRIGRLLEAIDTLRAEVSALRKSVDDLKRSVAHLEGAAE